MVWNTGLLLAFHFVLDLPQLDWVCCFWTQEKNKILMPQVEYAWQWRKKTLSACSFVQRKETSVNLRQIYTVWALRSSASWVRTQVSNASFKFFFKVHFFLPSVQVGKLSWNEPPELLIPREIVLFPSPSRIPFIIALIIMRYAHGI